MDPSRDNEAVWADVSATARRAASGARSGSAVRRVLAPLTAFGIVGLAAAAMVAPGQGAGLDLTDPSLAASRNFGVSRNYVRPSASVSSWAEASVLPTLSTANATSESPTAEPSESVAPDPMVAVATTSEPSAAETPSHEPVDYSALRDVAGTRFASSAVNLRLGPGVGYAVRDTLGEGKAVEVTAWAVDGWRQVVWSEESGWIKESFLAETKPVSEAAPAATSGGNSSGFSTEACAAAAGIESGLTTRTRAVLRAVCAEFPSVTSYGGYRSGGGSYHSSGQAIDVMVSGEAGWAIARWARANASALGIIEVLYSQQIWTAQRSGDGWRGFDDRGSVSANHYDHVHISVG